MEQKIAPENTNSLSCDSASKCPLCSYASPEKISFTICPSCGVVIAKLSQRRLKDTIAPQSASTNQPRHHATEQQSDNRLSRRFFIAMGITIAAIVILICYVHQHNTSKESSSESVSSNDKSLNLLKAVEKDDINKVNRLLFLGNNPNIELNGKTPLEIALMKENIEIARMLVEKGASIPYTSKGDEPTLIQKCILKNLVRSVSFLLSLKVPVDDLTPKGFAPLTVAAANGYVDMVKLLVEHGKSVNTRGSLSSTPLTEAARTIQVEMVRLLVKLGADVNAHGQFGYTPIMWGIKSDEIVNILIDAGADINAKSDNMNTPLHSAVGSLNLNAVKLLIEKGANVSAKDDRGVTPLKITTFHRNPIPDPFPEMAVLLKRAGAVE